MLRERRLPRWRPSFGPTQGQILALLLLDPGEAHSLADLARAVDAPPSVVHKGVGRLVEAGVLVGARQGRSRLIRPNPDYRLLRPLTELINGAYGPAPVLIRALAHVPAIDVTYIYGSWAARHEGVTGAHQRDIDVLVVGDASSASPRAASSPRSWRTRGCAHAAKERPPPC